MQEENFARSMGQLFEPPGGGAAGEDPSVGRRQEEEDEEEEEEEDEIEGKEGRRCGQDASTDDGSRARVSQGGGQKEGGRSSYIQADWERMAEVLLEEIRVLGEEGPSLGAGGEERGPRKAARMFLEGKMEELLLARLYCVPVLKIFLNRSVWHCKNVWKPKIRR